MNKCFCMLALAALLPVAASALDLPALDLWRYPQAAEKHSIFIDAAIAPLSFTHLSSYNVFPLEFRIDYMLPVGLPFSAGLFMKTPHPNLKHFGTRLGYHFDVRNPKTDLYVLYVFDFGFLRNDVLKEYNDIPAPLHFFDFRLGVRRMFGSWFCVAAETDFKVLGIVFLLSFKVN